MAVSWSKYPKFNAFIGKEWPNFIDKLPEEMQKPLRVAYVDAFGKSGSGDQKTLRALMIEAVIFYTKEQLEISITATIEQNADCWLVIKPRRGKSATLFTLKFE